MKLRTAFTVTAASAAMLAAGCSSSTPEPTDAGQSLGTAVGQPVPTNAPLPPVTTNSPEPDPLNAKFGQPYAVSTPTYSNGAEAAPDIYTVTVAAPVAVTGLLGTPHGRYISFTVTIKATSEGIETNPMYFYVRDPAGVHHNAGSTGEETLQSTTMHAGETLSGTIIADVPALHGTLAFDPIRSGPGGSLVEWPFSI